MSTAICWTLVHSVWQGLLLALFTGLVLAITRSSRPSLRYHLLSALFFLFLLATAFTFAHEIKNIPDQATIAPTESAPITISLSSTLHSGAPDGSIIKRLTLFLNTNAWLIISIWLCILAYRLLRITYSLVYTNYVRNHRANPLPEEWQHKLTRLCTRLKLTKPVLLLESAVIKIPAVYGYWKPVIFIPVGLLTQLPPDELEAILAHELAHIRRSDFGMNLMQNIIEAIFFFNPAVLWLSACIRQEREHCCDDLAIAESGDRKILVNALLNFRQFSINRSSSLVGFPGDRDSFLNRIARIVHNRNRSLNPLEGIFLAISLIVIGGLSVAFMHKEPESLRTHPASAQNAVTHFPETGRPSLQASPSQKQTIAHQTKTDTIPGKQKTSNGQSVRVDLGDTNDTDTISTTRNGDHYRIIVSGYEIIGLRVNGHEIPREEFENYDETIQKILRRQSPGEQEAMHRLNELITQRVQDEARLHEELKNHQQLNNEQQQYLERLENEAKALIAEQNKKQQDRNAELRELNAIQQEGNQRIAEEHEMQQKLNATLQKENAMKQEALIREQKALEQEQHYLQEKQAMIMRIINDIEQDHLLAPGKELKSFSLSSESFIINGTKQEAAIHQRYKRRYIREPVDRLDYSNR